LTESSEPTKLGRVRIAPRLPLALALVLAVSACGHTVAASSAAQAKRTGAAVCRQKHIHAALERAAFGGLVAIHSPSLVPRRKSRPNRPGELGTLVNALVNDSSYTRKQDLRAAFLGCVAVSWTPDLGPRPSVPADWRA
jgi:hypothetical protein